VGADNDLAGREATAVRLTDLEPHFLKLESPIVYRQVDSLAEAQGIEFLCPKCFEANSGRVGTHIIICWFKDRGVPDDLGPKPGRWNPSGTGYHDLTFVPPGATSVLLKGGCGWHGFIENGEVRHA
jgi:hypothetical protein